MGKKITGLDIAAYLIELGVGVNSPVSQLPLQKLVTLCQSKYVFDHDEKMFPDDVLAYHYGPVVGSVRKQYQRYGSNPIPFAGVELAPMPDNFFEVLTEVWALFAPLGNKLVDVTHAVGPWSKYFIDEKHTCVIPADELGEAWNDYKIAAKSLSSKPGDATPSTFCMPSAAAGEFEGIIESSRRQSHKLVMA